MALFGNAKFNDRVAELGDLSSAVIRVDKLPDPDPDLKGLTYQLADYQDKYVKNHVYTCIVSDGKAIWKDITSPYRIEHLPAVGSNDFGNDFANSKCYMANLYCDCDYMHIPNGMDQNNNPIYYDNWKRHYQEYAGTYYLFLLMASTKNKEFVEDDKWVKGQLVVKETKLPDEFPYTVEPMYFRPAVIYELTKRNWGDEENPKINPFGLPDVVLRTDGVIPCAHFLNSNDILKADWYPDGISAREDIFKHSVKSVSDPAYAVTPVDANITHDLPISTQDEESDEQVPHTGLSDEESDKQVVLPTGPLNRDKAKRDLAKWQFFGALLRKHGVARGYYKVDPGELSELAYTGNDSGIIKTKNDKIYYEALYIQSPGDDSIYLRIRTDNNGNACNKLARYIDEDSDEHRDVYRYIDINSPTSIGWSGNDVEVTFINASGISVSKNISHRVATWGYIEKYLFKADGDLTDIGDDIKAELDNKFEEYYNAVFNDELYPSRVEDGKVLLTYNIRHEYTQQPFIIGPLRDMDEKIVRKFRVFHTFSSGLVMYEGFQEDEYRMVHRIGAENSKWCKDALERSCAVVKRDGTSTSWSALPWFNLGHDCYHNNSSMTPTSCNYDETWIGDRSKQPLFWNLVMFYEQ